MPMARTIWFMHALGRDGLPAKLPCAGRHLVLEKTIKHDFFAATGFYRDDAGARYVVKINRRMSLLGWRLIGKWLGRRESRAYQKLADLPAIPDYIGPATDTGFVHAYVEGEPLSRDRPVPDSFFPELLELIAELNRRGIAYVDTNKPQNILHTDDGRPCLFDFQIHVDRHHLPILGRWLLGIFHRADVYHVLKHKRRFRPDQLTPEDLQRLEKRGFFVRLHRTITKPYFWIRRPLLRWLRNTGRVMPEGSK